MAKTYLTRPITQYKEEPSKEKEEEEEEKRGR